MNPLTTYEGAVLGREVCRGEIHVAQADIDAFCALFGYDDPAFRADAPGGAVAPSSMGLTYGLRLGWEHQVFPPGVIRMGDENVHGHPVRAGDVLTTVLTIADRFEKKGRRFLSYEQVTRNQDGHMVCSITFAAILP
jgi:acyl dehydratase